MSGRRVSKRRHAGEGPSAPSYDHRRFISKEAENYHNAIVLKRKLVKERGLVGYEEIMHQRHWEEYMAKSGVGNKTLVREFYANLRFTDHYHQTVTVRGADVDFSAETINGLFGTPQINEPNEYNEFAKEPPTLQTISEIICTGPPEWVQSAYNEPVGIPRTFLTHEAWDWLRFINARLYPSSHSSKVNKDRAIILYAIFTDVPLDVGRYIHDAIRKSARGGLSVSLYFPNLITTLCEREGIVNQPGDELIQPDTTINEENRAPPPPPAQRRQRRPREPGMEDRMSRVEDGLRNLQLQHERHMLEHQRLRVEQRQCWTALYDHLQVPPDRRPQFAPDEPEEPAPDDIGPDD
ncbi:hypothetical protein CDL12_03455 [Handroanthus impetiginosus]|uniref:Putative plant transposon protein domain-containing protein n=1 Tax=Handroanthus impetiginosus TaxID=429701 RepID=A0A2G9I2I5_9LAMI|nr:hypothetical protein CDL12_03455 [Handroanthus impetiginosus]